MTVTIYKAFLTSQFFTKINGRSSNVKEKKDAKIGPNQDYYVRKLDEMSFSRFIFPENKEEILRELQQTFRP